MKTTHRIQIDMALRGVPPRVYAMQFDANTRVVKILLRENGIDWAIPESATIGLSYYKPDGTSGYSEDGDAGESTFSVDASTVSVTLAGQILSAAGQVDAAVVFNDSDGRRIAAFPFEIHVEADPSAKGSGGSGNGSGNGSTTSTAVLYTPQNLTPQQQAQARANIGAAALPTPTAYLYNGVELPTLPQWDKEAFPYAVIDKNTNFVGVENYRLQLCDAVPLVYPTETPGQISYKPENGGHYIYRGINQAGEPGNWDYNTGAREFETYGIFADSILWSNCDIFNESGTLYLGASDPVPVYSGETGGPADAVLYTPQTLTPEQQAQARKNIGVEDSFENLDGVASASFLMRWYVIPTLIPADGTEVYVSDEAVAENLRSALRGFWPFTATVRIEMEDGEIMIVNGIFQTADTNDVKAAIMTLQEVSITMVDMGDGVALQVVFNESGGLDDAAAELEAILNAEY